MIAACAIGVDAVIAIIPQGHNINGLEYLWQPFISRLCRGWSVPGHLDNVKPITFDFSESTANSRLGGRQQQ
jgi:hypothetical protein